MSPVWEFNFIGLTRSRSNFWHNLFNFLTKLLHIQLCKLCKEFWVSGTQSCERVQNEVSMIISSRDLKCTASIFYNKKPLLLKKVNAPIMSGSKMHCKHFFTISKKVTKPIALANLSTYKNFITIKTQPLLVAWAQVNIFRRQTRRLETCSSCSSIGE